MVSKVCVVTLTVATNMEASIKENSCFLPNVNFACKIKGIARHCALVSSHIDVVVVSMRVSMIFPSTVSNPALSRLKVC